MQWMLLVGQLRVMYTVLPSTWVIWTYVSTQRQCWKADGQTIVTLTREKGWNTHQIAWTEIYYEFLVLGFLHGVRGEFPDDVSGPTAASETSSVNSPRTPCKSPKTNNQYSFYGGSLKSRNSLSYRLLMCAYQFVVGVFIFIRNMTITFESQRLYNTERDVNLTTNGR